MRKWQGDGEHHLISLRGAVLNAHGEQSVVLERGGIQVASAILDANSRFLLADQMPGEYLLRLAGTPIEQAVTLTADQRDVIVNLDMGAALEAASRSIVSGHVRGAAPVLPWCCCVTRMAKSSSPWRVTMAPIASSMLRPAPTACA